MASIYCAASHVPILQKTSRPICLLRQMITNAKNWATSRGLIRNNAVHGAEQFKLPTDEEFEFNNHRLRESEGTGSFEVEDPDGTLLNFGDMSAEQALMQLSCGGWVGYNFV